MFYSDRPRCETRAVFFVRCWILPFLGDFPAFLGLGGISYCPARKSVLNRKFGRNNFFRKKLQKLSTFFW